jgi:hypothetical protein
MLQSGRKKKRGRRLHNQDAPADAIGFPADSVNSTRIYLTLLGMGWRSEG